MDWDGTWEAYLLPLNSWNLFYLVSATFPGSLQMNDSDGGKETLSQNLKLEKPNALQTEAIMAEESPVQNLCEETSCPICLEYFTDPVIIDCGHIFCQSCITRCWGDPEKDACCPQCREPCQQRSFRPNRQLASIVEIAKKFSLQMAKGAEALGRVCERHQEPLKLFCEDDQALICVVCDKSKEHREHKVIPKEEAFEEYKDKLLSHLKFLNTEREEILSFKLTSESESQDLLEKTERERQKIVAEFKQLHQFLEEQEKFLLSQLKELDDEIKCCRDNHIAKLSEEISSMDSLIKEVEEKEKQTANEFLQDLKNILQRCNKEKFVNPTAFPPEINKEIDYLSEIHSSLETIVKNFKDTVRFTLQENKEILSISSHVTNREETSFRLEWSRPKIAVDGYVIRVDPKMKKKDWSAGELICLSGTENAFECRRLKPTDKYIVTIWAKKGQCYGPPTSQTVPTKMVTQQMSIPILVLSSSTYRSKNSTYNSYGYTNNNYLRYCWSTVKGTERITSGCHSWEVNVGTRSFWTVGVAGGKNQSEIWAVGKLSTTNNPQSDANHVYCAFASPAMPPGQFWIAGVFTNLKLPHSPQNICVSLNYEQGSVTFSDADDGSTIHTFKNALFGQEELCSYLSEGSILV